MLALSLYLLLSTLENELAAEAEIELLPESRADPCAETLLKTLPLIDDNVDSDIEARIEFDQEVTRSLLLVYRLAETDKLLLKPDKLALVESAELSSALVE